MWQHARQIGSIGQDSTGKSGASDRTALACAAFLSFSTGLCCFPVLIAGGTHGVHTETLIDPGAELPQDRTGMEPFMVLDRTGMEPFMVLDRTGMEPFMVLDRTGMEPFTEPLMVLDRSMGLSIDPGAGLSPSAHEEWHSTEWTAHEERLIRACPI